MSRRRTRARVVHVVKRSALTSEPDFELQAVLSVAEGVAREAGALIQRELGQSKQLDTKLNGRDLLTALDKSVQARVELFLLINILGNWHARAHRT